MMAWLVENLFTADDCGTYPDLGSAMAAVANFESAAIGDSLQVDPGLAWVIRDAATRQLKYARIEMNWYRRG